MMYSVYYGEISDARKENWDNGEENPYNVLNSNKKISPVGCSWMDFLPIARRLLRDEIQVDWGSFAWKANKSDILKLRKECNVTLEDAEFLKSGVEYGVVFVEEV